MKVPLSFPIPPRAAGQYSVRGLCTPPLGRVRVAFVGLGERGLTALRLTSLLEEACVTVLADVRHEAVEAARQLLATPPVHCFEGDAAWQEACRCADADLVCVCTDWLSHAPIAVEAMRQGKHVAVEVPAATTMDELWKLVDTAEQTRRHCFLLENCCYDADIQRAVEAVQRGDIGQPVHAEGAYYHPLGERWSPWRLDINRRQRGDLYPTHELGPICQALGINRTDRLQTLVCMDSASFTGAEMYKVRACVEEADFQNGDHTTTLLRTQRGTTILLRHDVMSPQSYDRTIHIIGTKGDIRAGEDGTDPEAVCTSFRSVHDPMTYEMIRRLIHSLAHGLPLDVDVYDLATWCAVIPLSRLSAEEGFVPVAVPDFDREH